MVRKLDIKISQRAKDIIQKYTSALFRNATLEFYGIKTARIKEPINVELPVIEVADTSTDFIFLLEDDTYQHFEFQTAYNKDDLIRFAKYDLWMYERDKREIMTVIIYSSDVKNAAENLKIGSLLYAPVNVMMYNYDGNVIYAELETKLKNEQDLTDIDILNLIFLPLMRNDIPKRELAKKSIQLAKTIKNKTKSDLCVASAIAFTNKYLSDDEINNLKGVFEMTDVFTKFMNQREIEIAIKLLKKGISVEDIAESIGIDLDTLNELQEQTAEENDE